MTVDIYQQYFMASCMYNDVPRRAVSVKLTSDSCEGNILYTASVSFFPHADEEDFAVSYDAYAERNLYQAKGRRSKKREALLLQDLRSICDELAGEISGTIEWDRPLRPARFA